MMSPAPILSLPDSFGVIYVGEVRIGVEGREGKGRWGRKGVELRHEQ